MNCDGCYECCISLPINDTALTKPENSKCTFCDKGCTIYEERPESCVNFNCVYIDEGYNESLRPDRSGVIFDRITTKIYYGLVSERRINTWDTIQMGEYIKSLNAKGISVVIAAFSTGITDIRCAKGHDINKVLEIALRYKN